MADPWEISTFTMLGLIVLTGLGVLGFMNREKLPEGISEIPFSLISFIANVFPFGILIYGLAADLIHQSFFRSSIPTISALISICVIGIATKTYANVKGANLSAQDTSGRFWCTLPGLEQVESPYLPTAFISTALIGFYYMCWAMRTEQGISRIGTMFFAVWVTQFLTFITGDCISSYYPIIGNVTVLNVLIATVLGGLIGFATYLMFSEDLSYNPLNTSGVNTTVKKDGGLTRVGHSYPEQSGGDENTFVAELYKDGQLVTDTLAPTSV
jgi:hypothetical protein